MVTPVDFSCSVGTGLTMRAGRAADDGYPAWRDGLTVGNFVELSGTSGAGGSAIDAYSSFIYDDLTGDLIIAAAGGHSDSSDNRVVSINILADAPSVAGWVLREASSTTTPISVSHYPDGKPSSRHTYGHIHISQSRRRVMLMGGRFIYAPAGEQSAKVDGFNLTTDNWDAANTFGDAPAGWYGEVQDATGNIWSFLNTALGARKWTDATDTWSAPSVTIPAGWVRRPWVLNTSDDTLFGLCWADNEGSGSAPAQINALRFNPTTLVMDAITFNSSAAKTQFIADTPAYSGMDYDPENDRFLFYASGTKRIFIVTPNAGTTWDMAILTPGGYTVPSVAGAGVQCRWRYVAALKGFIFLPQASSNLIFLPVA